MSGRFTRILCWSFLAACLGNAQAQNYPSKPVSIIVPYPAGGVPDVLARTVGQRLSESLGRQFVVDYKPGAGGISAVMTLVNSAPDGHTLLMGDSTHTAINLYVLSKLPYHPLKDFTPVTIVANSIQYMAVNPRFGSFSEFVSYAKANPGKLNYGSTGVGGLHHIAVETIKSGLGLDLTHVPYKGMGQAVPALVADEVQMVLGSLPALVSHVKAGKARLVAVSSLRRAAQTPDVPAVSEFIPGYDFTAGLGLLAPAGTPGPIVSLLATEVAKAMKHPDTVARFTSFGLDPVGSTPEAYAALIRSEVEKYAVAVKISGVKPE